MRSPSQGGRKSGCIEPRWTTLSIQKLIAIAVEECFNVSYEGAVRGAVPKPEIALWG